MGRALGDCKEVFRRTLKAQVVAVTPRGVPFQTCFKLWICQVRLPTSVVLRHLGHRYLGPLALRALGLLELALLLRLVYQNAEPLEVHPSGHVVVHLLYSSI